MNLGRVLYPVRRTDGWVHNAQMVARLFQPARRRRGARGNVRMPELQGVAVHPGALGGVPAAAGRSRSAEGAAAGPGETGGETGQPVLIQTDLTLRYSSTCCLPLSRP